MPPAAPAAHDAAVRDAVRRVWGFDALRPQQRDAIAAGLEKRDSLVVLPTGGGKSLCYQVPPLVANRFDLVVSPLISLMKDQVDGLRELGYPAAALYSGLSRDEHDAVVRRMLSGELRLLFAAPERLLGEGMIRLLRQARTAAVAVDEAHCISHWGHDFRPDYRQLARLRAELGGVPVHAFTATATPRVRRDIVEQLGLRDPQEIVGVFDRPNLVYRIIPRVDAEAQTLEVLTRRRGEAAIVYCISRRDTERVAAHLLTQRVKAAHYHAGMDADERRRTQEAFAEERLDVVVATVAFGMGIDRSNVRCVLHTAMPQSVEHYQQETGRAGRDGLPAECVMLYSGGDSMRWEKLLSRQTVDDGEPASAGSAESSAASKTLLAAMRRFCAAPVCRHRGVSEYFGQTYPQDNCAACDVCLGELSGYADATVVAQKILSCVARVKERFGVGHVVDVLRGKTNAMIQSFGHEHLSTYGLLKEMDAKLLTQFVHQLLDQELLARTPGERPVLRLNAASWEVMRGLRTVHLQQAPTGARTARVELDEWRDVDRELFERLRGWRRELAASRGVPPYVILSDRTLRDISRRRPTRRDQLQGTVGIGPKKMADLGDAIVAEVRGHLGVPEANGGAADSAAQPHWATEDDAGLEAPRRTTRGAAAHAATMFAEGRSIAEVARQLNRAASTVTQYLAAYILEHKPADVSAWVDQETYDRVAAAATECGLDRLSPIHEKLGGSASYEQIRVVTAHLQIAGEIEL